MTKVKICGINDPVAFDSAVDAGVDWIGFNFFPASPRYISAGTAAALSARTAGSPPRVGLFVEPSDALIAAVLDTVSLDILQIYGRTNEFSALKTRFGLPVWRPVGIATWADLPTDALGADMLVLEAKPPAKATRPGGNAASFDWYLLRDWVAPAPWILAGGLTPTNVAAAIRRSGASAVDVSSGVEAATGLKDPALIHAFVRQANQ